ncbi:MAG: ISAzo13 family transposase [Deltaproteobacteria bacterium]|jgi:transposase|nr:ISAzo13 family transposase [Deltaproteobacteria bacterium]
MIDLKAAFEALGPHINEKTRRLFAASLALSNEYGLRSKISKETGVSFQAIRKGLVELKEGTLSGNNSLKIRKPGGGRKKLSAVSPELLEALKRLVGSTTGGDPESLLLWTCKSLRNLADELTNLGFRVSHSTVASMLDRLGYSLQANKKVLEGADHPDRNAQFEFINNRAKAFQRLGQPVISIDCKKHELIGNYKNNGCEYQPKGNPIKVKDHDFIDKDLGKIIPFGIYDIAQNNGYVNTGVDHDISTFAVQSIRNWWISMGLKTYPNAARLFISADCGGSNGYRRKLWKAELSKFAKESNLCISVCHFPAGTSKWTKIEHCFFSHITMNWRGRPLVSHEVVVNLIGSTKTNSGLAVKCDLDLNEYPIGIKVSDEEIEKIKVKRAKFHGEWNYTFLP